MKAADFLPVTLSDVTLRRLRPDDLAAFQQYRGDPEVGLYQGWGPMSDAKALDFLIQMHDAPALEKGCWFQYGVAERVSDKLIGDVGVCLSADGARIEIGLSFGREWQGKGLAAQTVRASLRLLFEHSEAQEIVAVSDARNGPSIRLLERCAMRLDKTEQAIFCGLPCSEHHYRIARAERAALG